MVTDSVIIGKKNGRCWEIDFVRGICMIYVSIYHFCFIGNRIARSSLSRAVLENAFFEGIHYPIVFVLFFISGISRAFTKNDFRRFLKIAICASIISIVTFMATFFVSGLGSVLIVFGVLHTISSSIIIYMLFVWLISKLKIGEGRGDAILLSLGIVIIIIGLLYLNNIASIADSVPFWATFLVSNNRAYQISPGDFFALFPMLGFYIYGAVFGKHFYSRERRKPRGETPLLIKPITWFGKYSLWVYLAVPVLSVIIFSL